MRIVRIGKLADAFGRLVSRIVFARASDTCRLKTGVLADKG